MLSHHNFSLETASSLRRFWAPICRLWVCLLDATSASIKYCMTNLHIFIILINAQERAVLYLLFKKTLYKLYKGGSRILYYILYLFFVLVLIYFMIRTNFRGFRTFQIHFLKSDSIMFLITLCYIYDLIFMLIHLSVLEWGKFPFHLNR